MFLLKKLNVNEPVYKSSDRLLNLRFFFFATAWIHLIVLAVMLLSIDLSVDDDPRIKAYDITRYKLVTTWFNFILLAYFPTCLYCDWKEKCNQEYLQHVVVLRKIRDIVFTSILFPTIMFADIMFWRLYNKDVNLIAPKALFEYMPAWSQHSLHTVSMITSVIDLCLVYRQRPKSLKFRFLLMTCFGYGYAFVIWSTYLDGHVVYKVFDVFTRFQSILLIFLCYLEYNFHFIMQWHILDYVWGKPKTK